MLGMRFLLLLFLVSDPTFGEIQKTTQVLVLTGQDATPSCTQGSYAAGNACVPCVQGWTTPGNGSTSAADCSLCAAGYYLQGVACVLCPSGLASNIGAVSVAGCTLCAAGYYTSSSSCAVCPYGTFSQINAASCTDCPAGYFSSGGSGSCGACPVNYYSAAAGSVACLVCPNSTYSDTTGSTVCNDADNIPDWYLLCFTGMLLFMCATSLYAVTMKWTVPQSPVYVEDGVHHPMPRKEPGWGRWFISIYGATLLPIIISAMPFNENATSEVWRPILMIVIAALLLVLTALGAFIGFRQPKTLNMADYTGFYVTWQVASLVLVIVTCVRLLHVDYSTIVFADIPVLFMIYVTIQVHVTYTFTAVSTLGQWHNPTAFALVIAFMIFTIVLPLSALHAGLMIGDDNWQTHDYQNVSLVNAIFGMLVTSLSLVIRTMSTLKQSVGDSRTAIRAALRVLSSIDRAHTLINDPAYIFKAESPRYIADALQEMGSKMFSGNLNIVCAWLERITKECEANDKAMMKWIVEKVGVLKNEYRTQQKCEDSYQLFLRLVGVSLNVQGFVRRDIAAEKCLVLQLHSVLDEYIHTQLNPKRTERFVSTLLDETAGNSIVTQMLVATGFYGSVTSLVSSAHTYRNNFLGAPISLFYLVLIVVMFGVVVIMIWLGVGGWAAWSTKSEIDRYQMQLTVDCRPEDCEAGKEYFVKCDTRAVCEECKTECGVGQYPQGTCGTVGRRNWDGCENCPNHDNGKLCPGEQFYDKDRCGGAERGCSQCSNDGTHCADGHFYVVNTCGNGHSGCTACDEELCTGSQIYVSERCGGIHNGCVSSTE